MAEKTGGPVPPPLEGLFVMSPPRPPKTPQFLDVDLLKDSSAFYTKPKGDMSVVFGGFKRVFGFPLFVRWWLWRIHPRHYCLYVLLAFLHLAVLWTHRREDEQQLFARITGCKVLERSATNTEDTEIVVPVILLLILGLAYGKALAAAGPWREVQSYTGHKAKTRGVKWGQVKPPAPTRSEMQQSLKQHQTYTMGSDDGDLARRARSLGLELRQKERRQSHKQRVEMGPKASGGGGGGGATAQGGAEARVDRSSAPGGGGGAGSANNEGHSPGRSGASGGVHGVGELPVFRDQRPDLITPSPPRKTPAQARQSQGASSFFTAVFSPALASLSNPSETASESRRPDPLATRLPPRLTSPSGLNATTPPLPDGTPPSNFSTVSMISRSDGNPAWLPRSRLVELQKGREGREAESQREFRVSTPDNLVSSYENSLASAHLSRFADIGVHPNGHSLSNGRVERGGTHGERIHTEGEGSSPGRDHAATQDEDDDDDIDFGAEDDDEDEELAELDEDVEEVVRAAAAAAAAQSTGLRREDMDTRESTPFETLSGESIKVTVWDGNMTRYKVTMTLEELRNVIVKKANEVPPVAFYARTLHLGASLVLAFLPFLFRLLSRIHFLSKRASLDLDGSPTPLGSTFPEKTAAAASATVSAAAAAAQATLAEGFARAQAPILDDAGLGTGYSAGAGTGFEADSVTEAGVAAEDLSLWSQTALGGLVPPSLVSATPPIFRPMVCGVGNVLTAGFMAVTGVSQTNGGDDRGLDSPDQTLGCLSAQAGKQVIAFGATLAIVLVIFTALAETERTLQRRLAYAKFFTALTSSQRARRYQLPHFSLKKILNIKVWLGLRAGRGWLKRFRHQRVTDSVVSMTFVTFIMIMAAVISEFFRTDRPFPSTLAHWEILVWWFFLSLYLLRFLMLGMRINKRYQNSSVLLTEQMNVQLRILESEDKEKRERLAISHKVLELAMKLLKEFDSPNTISGISMNPVLYNVTRVVLFSALSAALSEFMGFDIKMWKLKGI